MRVLRLAWPTLHAAGAGSLVIHTKEDNVMKHVINFEVERETKNTVRFQEVVEPGHPPIIGTLSALGAPCWCDQGHGDAGGGR